MSLIAFTQFVNTYFAAWSDNVTDPTLSKSVALFDYDTRYGVQKRKMEEVALNNLDSYELSLVNLQQSDWITLVIVCVGEGYITTVGKDDLGNAISCNIPIYGYQPLPGIFVLSTYNLTQAPTITSILDGTIFEVFEATCLPDGS